ANKHGQQHLLAIAQRRALSEAVTEVLVVRGDREVISSVARNEGARFSGATFRALVARSSGDDELAVHVGARRDLPRQHLLKLIEAASASVRQKLAAADPETAAAVREVVAEIDVGLRAAPRRTMRAHGPKSKRFMAPACSTRRRSAPSPRPASSNRPRSRSH